MNNVSKYPMIMSVRNNAQWGAHLWKNNETWANCPAHFPSNYPQHHCPQLNFYGHQYMILFYNHMSRSFFTLHTVTQLNPPSTVAHSRFAPLGLCAFIYDLFSNCLIYSNCSHHKPDFPFLSYTELSPGWICVMFITGSQWCRIPGTWGLSPNPPQLHWCSLHLQQELWWKIWTDNLFFMRLKLN